MHNKSSGNVLGKQLIAKNTATNAPPPITSVHSIIQQVCTDCLNVTYTLEIQWMSRSAPVPVCVELWSSE